jgi:NAD(P)-dependent dehydrogenase (short-subunit alcohol dehydrogenase family)
LDASRWSRRDRDRGARGIGRETAETLAVAGARVVLADLDKEMAEGAASEIRALGLHATAIVADIADEVRASDGHVNP